MFSCFIVYLASLLPRKTKWWIKSAIAPLIAKFCRWYTKWLKQGMQILLLKFLLPVKTLCGADNREYILYYRKRIWGKNNKIWEEAATRNSPTNARMTVRRGAAGNVIVTLNSSIWSRSTETQHQRYRYLVTTAHTSL